MTFQQWAPQNSRVDNKDDPSLSIYILVCCMCYLCVIECVRLTQPLCLHTIFTSNIHWYSTRQAQQPIPLCVIGWIAYVRSVKCKYSNVIHALTKILYIGSQLFEILRTRGYVPCSKVTIPILLKTLTEENK